MDLTSAILATLRTFTTSSLAETQERACFGVTLLEAIEVGEGAIKEEHVWSHGDTLFRLSRKYYGTDKLWTSIALINRKPTDAHYSIGDVVYIVEDPNAVTGRI